MVKQSDVAADFINVEGLRDATAVLSGTTTTDLVSTLSYQFDGFSTVGAVKSVPLGGWLVADFALYNMTTGLDVTISGATEAPDGTYSISYAGSNVRRYAAFAKCKGGVLV